MNDAQKIILMGKADELLAEAERVNETPTHIVRASALMGAEWMDEQYKQNSCKALCRWCGIKCSTRERKRCVRLGTFKYILKGE